MNSQNSIDVGSLTREIAEESNNRADKLQRLAFESSLKSLGKPSGNYFVVSREYYSSLFYGFFTNIPYTAISNLARFQNKNKNDEVQHDLVGFFRDEFSESFNRRGPLKTLTNFLNDDRSESCAAIAIFFNWKGEVVGRKAFDSNFLEISNTNDFFKKTLNDNSNLEDTSLCARALQMRGDNLHEENIDKLNGGYCLLVCSDKKVSDESSMRRKPLQLMQIALQVFTDKAPIEYEAYNVPDQVRSAIASSCVAAYSVLYERERYFEKSIRQAIKGTMIKWGDSQALLEFQSQLAALHSCNGAEKTHAAPYVIQYGILPQFDPIKDKQRHKDHITQYPWYEMVRYNLPSLDRLLTSTPGLKPFEIRAIAKAVFEHLENHFWKISQVTSRQEKFNEVNSGQVTAVILETLRYSLFGTLNKENSDKREKLGSISTVEQRLKQWKNDIPIQVEKKGLTIPKNTWNESSRSLWKAYFDIERADFLKIHLKSNVQSNDIIKVNVEDIEKKLISLIRSCQKDCREVPVINLPKFLTNLCHGDPHFENIFVDASIPEDAFIVAIDPAKRGYEIDFSVLNDCVDFWGKEEIKNFVGSLGIQPMQDVSKLLLSTTGGYALALNNGFSSKFVAVDIKDEAVEGNIYTLSWQVDESSAPLGPNSTGVSNAKLFMRSISATPESKKYQGIFSSQILKSFDEIVQDQLNHAKIFTDSDKVVCKNIYYLQVWSLLTRHVFSISEKFFPDDQMVSEQLFAIAYYLFDAGSKYIQEHGPQCIMSADMSEALRRILSMNAIMELDND